MKWIKILFPYLLFAAMAAGIIFSNWGHRRPPQAAQGEGKKVVDPVCRMAVNVNWGIYVEHEGTTHHFCTDRCETLFVHDPNAHLGIRCMVCDKRLELDEALSAIYIERYYYLCTPEHREQFKADPAAYFMHRMWGIPDWLYYLSIGLMLLVSFAVFEGAKRVRKSAPAAGPEPPADRLDLLRLRFLKHLLLSRVFRFACQLLVVLAFLVIISAGLFGHQNPALNIAPLLTWTIWWCGLVVLIMFVGKAWCYVCPWDALATWMERLRLWKKSEEGLGLGLPWPRPLRNIWLATFFFVGLTWIELGFGVTMSPRSTAYLALAMVLMTIVSIFLFDRKGFCRYGCLVGRVSGLYALFAGMEVRARDPGLCRNCKTRECVRGSDTAYACPTFERPFQMQANTYCIQCCECLQACPHDNMTVNLRPWGADLAHEVNPRRDEAYLCLLMLSISAFHGLTMTPVWRGLLEGIEAILPWSRIISFSASMVVLLGLPILLYTVLVALSFWVSRSQVLRRTDTGRELRYSDYFIQYAYCLLPIALFYHLAHNLEHLLMEGPKIVARLSDPFGWNWNLFNTANLHIPPLVSLDILWILQVLLVGVGHMYSLWAAQKISSRFFGDQRSATRGQFPVLIGMIAFSILSLWLLKQPMEMRSSAM